jgi:hypothetical protein
MQQMTRMQRAQGQQKQIAAVLQEAGDPFELCARMALGAPSARKRRADESDVFCLGFLTAAKQIGLALRAMRRGVPPTASEMEAARLEAIAECAPDDPA